VCIFSYWIYYAGPGCIVVHLPLTTVGVCVDPIGGGQVYAGGVDGNVHVKPVSGVPVRVPRISSHPRSKRSTSAAVEPEGNVAVDVLSVGVAVYPPTVEGLHVDTAVGGGSVIVVLPSGQVSATAQDASACLCLASAVLLMVLSLDASEAELELLLAVFLFGLTLVFVILWLGSTFRVIGNFLSLSLLACGSCCSNVGWFCCCCRLLLWSENEVAELPLPLSSMATLEDSEPGLL
jgi:hypothetical protein